MALLTTEQRQEIARHIIQTYFVGLAHTADLTTAEIQTLVNDLDAWLDTQLTEANNAISEPVRSKASAATKFAGLALVASKRAGIR